jgi:hypothetical protein
MVVRFALTVVAAVKNFGCKQFVKHSKDFLAIYPVPLFQEMLLLKIVAGTNREISKNKQRPKIKQEGNGFIKTYFFRR